MTFHEMKKLFIFLVLSALTGLSVFGQETLYKPYEFPEKISGKYIVNVEEEYNREVNNKMKKVSQNVNKRFAESSVFSKQELFSSGNIYIGFSEIETYINSVLGQIIPDTLKNKSYVKGYLARDPETNAYAMHDGTVLVNIGLLADVVNEAGLAIILGHEIAHFINEDPKKSFVKNIKLHSRKNRNKNLELAIDKAHADKEQEKNADLLGFSIAEKAGYDLVFGINNFEQFKADEAIYNRKKAKSRIKQDTLGVVISRKKKYTEPLEKLLSSHPSLEDRITFLQKYMESKERSGNKKDFIVDKNAFEKFQKTAKLETVYILFEKNDYRECIERAFKYHLIEPDEINYIYYLLESIRRITYLDSRMKAKGFLTEDNKSGRFKKGEGLLHDLSFLMPDSLQLSKIRSLSLADTSFIEFETYGQAFDYFSKLAIEKNITESYLTMALFQTDTSKRNDLLTSYIGKKDAEKKEFAQALLGEHIHSLLDSNKLDVILLDKIDFYQKRYSGLHELKMYALKKSPAYSSAIKAKIEAKYPDKKMLLLEELEHENLKAKLDYYKAIDASLYSKSASKTKVDQYYSELEKDETKQTGIDYYMLKPELWYFMKTNEIRSIDYAHLAQYDNREVVSSYFNPVFLLYLPYWLIQRAFVSDRYEHYLYYYSFNVKAQKQYYYERGRAQRLNPNRGYRRIAKALKYKSKPKTERELIGMVAFIPIYRKK